MSPPTPPIRRLARRRPTGGGVAGAFPSRRARADDERGVYASFIAVIASALLIFGGVAYDAPRLTTARQDALHAANEAARVAAGTIAAGGTVDDAVSAAKDRVQMVPLVYGEPIRVVALACVGTRVQVTVQSGYSFRSVLFFVRRWQPIEAIGAAEAFVVLPGSDTPSALQYLSECPL